MNSGNAQVLPKGEVAGQPLWMRRILQGFYRSQGLKVDYGALPAVAKPWATKPHKPMGRKRIELPPLKVRDYAFEVLGCLAQGNQPLDDPSAGKALEGRYVLRDLEVMLEAGLIHAVAVGVNHNRWDVYRALKGLGWTRDVLRARIRLWERLMEERIGELERNAAEALRRRLKRRKSMTPSLP